MRKTLIAFVATLMLAGCTGLDPHRQIVADLGIEVATLRFVDDRPERAERVQGIAMYTSALLASEDVTTIAALQALIEARIDWTRYDPVEAALGRAVIQMVAIDLGAVAGERDSLLDDEVRDRLMHLLGLIERATGDVLARA